jgi:hypothetical protein
MKLPVPDQQQPLEPAAGKIVAKVADQPETLDVDPAEPHACALAHGGRGSWAYRFLAAERTTRAKGIAVERFDRLFILC